MVTSYLPVNSRTFHSRYDDTSHSSQCFCTTFHCSWSDVQQTDDASWAPLKARLSQETGWWAESSSLVWNAERRWKKSNGNAHLLFPNNSRKVLVKKKVLAKATDTQYRKSRTNLWMRSRRQWTLKWLIGKDCSHNTLKSEKKWF